MSGIGGKTRPDYVPSERYVGVFEGEVIAINPSREEYKDILGIELSEESKATEYIGITKGGDGNTYLRIDFWMKELTKETNFKVSFFLEDKERSNKDETKFQYINNVGITSWADSESSLLSWFKSRPYRIAKAGEEELYGFLRNWLSKLDYRDAETELVLNWSKLMKGDVRELRAQIGGEYAKKVMCAAIVNVAEKDGNINYYQNVYNRTFLPEGSLKFFRLNDYSDEETLNKIRAKKIGDLKFHERFVASIADLEYGCKDIYSLKELEVFNEEVHIVSGGKVIEEEDPSY